MPMFVHVTARCQDDASKHGVMGLVANIKKQVETTQSLTGFDDFHPTAFIKKALGRSFRMVCYTVPVGSDDLVLFLRVLARGGNEYEDFLKKWDKDPERLKQQFQPYDDAQIRAILASLVAQPTAEIPPAPSEDERAWLYEVLRAGTDTDDLQVLETIQWVRKMRAAETREFLALYHQAVEQLDPRQLPPAVSNIDCKVHWDRNNGRVGIAYLLRSDINRLLLLEPLRKGDDVERVLAEHRERLATVGETTQDLSRVAGRSYPYLMVLDHTAWLAIQKDEESNLALSPEESELLESIRETGAEDKLGFPLFINGRAGSGKSTMLQYLAADYVDFALRRNTTLLPIFMTCSRDLLERARITVRGLLTAHHERLLREAHNSSDIDTILHKSFSVFQEFLHSLLQPHDKDRFEPTRHVSFAEFRRLWTTEFARRPEAKRTSPDVAWHTIRAYIKGIRSTDDDELAPEEFEALPRRRRSVSVETYRWVYDRVWSSWYKGKCQDEGYWDDQDLAAAVLVSGAARQTDFAAVFCDEAQDFTPIELQIISQLSVHAKRSLVPEELRRVPIVFAGDPLQTINPTGFRWEAVQADFHERFCAVLDPRRRARFEISYCELRFNYRSNPGIVKFCNLIQLVRAAILGGRDVLPQEAWWIDEAVQTVWFASDNTYTKQQLLQRPGLLKIVNCEDGEESTFARTDAILAELNDESAGVFRNVLGPTRAKGLEFPAVVVYRFAESSPPDALRIITGDLSFKDDPEKRLPFEYFFNRLYVAASRAKGQLVIVDSSRSVDAFWRFATDPDIVDRLIKQTKEPKLWKDAIAFLVRGREESWSGERIDPREQGADYAAQGRRKRDPYLMRQAALAYRSANDEGEAGRCLALAAEFDGKLRDAGDRYREIGSLDEAFKCYWQGQHFGSICEIAALDAGLAARLESRAADFAALSAGSIAPTFLEEVLKATGDPTWRIAAASDATWKQILTKLAERLSKAGHDRSVPWRAALSAFRQLLESGLTIPDQILGSIAYSAGDYAAAVAIWERVGATERDEYRRAKARVAFFPENILWFSRLRDRGEVLAQWNTNRANVSAIGDLDEAVVAAVIDAALGAGEIRLASELLTVKPSREQIAALMSAAAKAKDNTTLCDAALTAVRLLVKVGAWSAVARAAENQDFGDLPKGPGNSAQAVLRACGASAIILRTAIEEIARSPELAAESQDRRGPIADLLHRTFIGKGAAADKRGLQADVIGAAIERAGKIVDALQYYENLARDPGASEEVKRFASERLVRNLERHAAYWEERGDKAEAREREARARSTREAARLGERQFPDFPVLAARTDVESPSEWRRGQFRFVLSRAHARLRIEHAERFETVTVYVQERQLRGDAEFTKLPAEQDIIASWRIPTWDITIQIANANGGTTVSAHFADERFDVDLRMPA